MNTYWPRARWLSPRALELEELLLRYPRISAAETRKLVRLYRQLTTLDVATILADDGLSAKLDRFRNDHADSLRKFRIVKVRIMAALLIAGAIAAATLM